MLARLRYSQLGHNAHDARFPRIYQKHPLCERQNSRILLAGTLFSYHTALGGGPALGCACGFVASECLRSLLFPGGAPRRGAALADCVAGSHICAAHNASCTIHFIPLWCSICLRSVRASRPQHSCFTGARPADQELPTTRKIYLHLAE